MNLAALENRRDELIMQFRKGDRTDALYDEFREINRKIADLRGPEVKIERGWVDAQRGRTNE